MQEIHQWLLEGDVAIQYQTYRDLLDEDRTDLQQRIAHEGWGKKFLSKRKSAGHWGQDYYQPKWISTHYTLLDLRLLELAPDHPAVHESIQHVIETQIAEDGGISLGPSTLKYSDVCVNAMFLNFASYFQTKEELLRSIVDSILNEHMADGGFNCRTTRSGAKHSSMHTTISVLEGFQTYLSCGYTYKNNEIRKASQAAEEFLLVHQLYLSDRTGTVIKPEFLKLSFPGRWKYNVLRALDYFQSSGCQWDDRMQSAIDVLLSKRNKNDTWNVQAAHAGQVHFTMEKAGKPSRWNTLRALRVLKHFNIPC